MKTALVTGIAGQVGSHLADLLIEKGYEVIGVIKPTTVLDRIQHIKHKVLLYYTGYVPQTIQVDEVYNLAADSSPAGSWDDPKSVVMSTAQQPTRTLDWTRKHFPKARFYQASSSECFGDTKTSPQNETTPFSPRNPYGCAKVLGHQMVRCFRERYGLYAVSGISYNCEGPRRGPEFVTRKISKAVGAIKRGEQTELVLGNLDARRDWGYVGDYVEAIWLTLQQDEPRDYVIATGVQHSVAEFCAAAFARVDLDWKQYVKTDQNLRPEADRLVGDPSRIKAYCGWEAKTKFVDLVHLMVDADR